MIIMKNKIPDLLLVVATATAALSASSSRRPWRELDFKAGEDYQEFLAFDLSLGNQQKASEGARLNAELTTQLDALGFNTVRVRNPAVPVVIVPIDKAAGEVLAEAVPLPGQTETLPKGRLVDSALDLRATEAGVTLTTDDRGKLSQAATLPKRMRSSAFLDADNLAELSSAGVTEVPVKRAAAFRWEDWSGRWAFLISALVMTCAVAWKRKLSVVETAAASSGTSLETLRGRLVDLSQRVSGLSDRAAGMSAEELHTEIDALLQGPAYDFVEGRALLQRAAGMSVFALVMDPFSRGERQLSRAWSASVDQHEEEARESITKAAPLIREASEAFPS